MTAATAALQQGGIADAPRDVRLLMAFALSVDPVRLLLREADAIEAGAAAVFDALIARRLRHEPVAQITGQRLFWGRQFRVTRDTLDPRPDTETLVAAALEEPFAKVLDLGTGSGCILISCLADRPTARGIGTDLYDAALAIAKGNAETLGVATRADFALSDWFTAVDGRFDLIVSNPPYIAAAEMAGLDPDVRDWEPHQALTPGGDGLDACRAIAAGAGARLMTGGRLIVEIGPTQAAAVTELFMRVGLSGLRVLQDMDGRDRVVLARKP